MSGPKIGPLAKIPHLTDKGKSTVKSLQAKFRAWSAGLAQPQWPSMRRSVRRYDGQALQLHT